MCLVASRRIACSWSTPTRLQYRNSACWALRDNPQNTDSPQVSPQLEYSPKEAVTAQLEALKEKDVPWYNHGIQVMYEFGEDVGGLDRSQYFGYGKDLYHFDHFMGEFSNKFQDIIDHSGFQLEQGEQSETVSQVTAKVLTREGATVTVQFMMKVKDIGRNKGRWMTKTIRRIDS